MKGLAKSKAVRTSDGVTLSRVLGKLKASKARANAIDSAIVRELIAVARKERASLHSLVASLSRQINHTQELIEHFHGLIARLDEVLLLLENHNPTRLAESIRKSRASAVA